MSFFCPSRIDRTMPVRAKCFVCSETKDQCKSRDRDYAGRFVCDECFPFDRDAERFLRLRCELATPSDALLDQHL
jgi:hypothetical protein